MRSGDIRKRQGYDCMKKPKGERKFPQEIALLIVVGGAIALAVACSGGSNANPDKAAIEQVIRGYVSSYNASNFEETLTYFTGFSDSQDALAYLAYLREQSGPLELVNFDPDSISVIGDTARVPVDFIIMGEQGSQWLNLSKEVDGWKILWEQ